MKSHTFMSGVNLNGYDVVILEGTSVKDNKPYSFAKLDKRISNNPSFISAVRAAGAIIIRNGKVDRGAQAVLPLETPVVQ